MSKYNPFDNNWLVNYVRAWRAKKDSEDGGSSMPALDFDLSQNGASYWSTMSADELAPKSYDWGKDTSGADSASVERWTLPFKEHYMQLEQELALQQMQYQNALGLASWQYQFDTTNEYNSPANVMARIQAAGINPNALAPVTAQAGSAASPSFVLPSGGMPSPPSVTSPAMHGNKPAETFQAMSALVNSLKGVYDSSDLNPQQSLTRQTIQGQIERLALENVNSELQNSLSGLQKMFEERTLQPRTAMAFVELSRGYQGLANDAMQGRVLDMQAFDAMWDAFLKQATVDKTLSENSQLIMQLPYAKAMMLASIRQMNTQSGLNVAQAEMSRNQSDLFKNQATAQDIENALNYERMQVVFENPSNLQTFRNAFINELESVGASRHQIEQINQLLVLQKNMTQKDLNNYWITKILPAVGTIANGAGMAALIRVMGKVNVPAKK